MVATTPVHPLRPLNVSSPSPPRRRRRAAAEAYAYCLKSGVGLFDTAELYGFGRSEEVLRECERKHGAGLVATKVGRVVIVVVVVARGQTTTPPRETTAARRPPVPRTTMIATR